MAKVIKADGDWYVVPDNASEPRIGQKMYDTRAEAQAEADRQNGK